VKLPLTLLPILILNTSFCLADSVPALSNEDLDGLYYVSPNDSLVNYLVLSHDGKSLPEKFDDPGAPTTPGLYYKDVRFQITSFKLRKSAVGLKTAEVDKIQFRFKGKIKTRNDPQFNVPLISLHGTLEMINNGHITQRQQIIFEKGVVY
jgi:hypothetical protein